MKKFLPFFTLGMLAFCLALFSCEKDSDTEELTVDEAVEYSTSVLGSVDNSAAMSVAASYGTAVVITPASYCGVTIDTTLGHTNTQGTYTSDWTYYVNCNSDGVPTSLDLQTHASGNYQKDLTSAAIEGQGIYTLSGLLSSDTSLLFNGDYSSTGTVTTTEGVTYNTVIAIKLVDFVIDKLTKTIATGSATITLIAINTKGDSTTFEGDFTVSQGIGTLVMQSPGRSADDRDDGAGSCEIGGW